MSERQKRIACTAKARNMMLLWLGYKARVPECETEGHADAKARRTYLVGVECGFTRSDRSMAVWDGKRQAWRLIVEDSWYPQLFRTKAEAMAAGRKAEQQRDAYARTAAAREIARRTAPLRSPYVQSWAANRDSADAVDSLVYERQDGAY